MHKYRLPARGARTACAWNARLRGDGRHHDVVSRGTAYAGVLCCTVAYQDSGMHMPAAHWQSGLCTASACVPDTLVATQYLCSSRSPACVGGGLSVQYSLLLSVWPRKTHGTPSAILSNSAGSAAASWLGRLAS